MGHKTSLAAIIFFDNIEIAIVKSSLTLLKLMSRSESEPVSIATVHRPSLGDLKRLYAEAMGKPNCWITFFWEDPKGGFNAVNPYRETRSPRRQAILQALSPETGDEEEFLSAEITIHDMARN